MEINLNIKAQVKNGKVKEVGFWHEGAWHDLSGYRKLCHVASCTLLDTVTIFRDELINNEKDLANKNP